MQSEIMRQFSCQLYIFVQMYSHNYKIQVNIKAALRTPKGEPAVCFPTICQTSNTVLLLVEANAPSKECLQAVTFDLL